MTRIVAFTCATLTAAILTTTITAQAPAPQAPTTRTFDSLSSLKSQYTHVRDSLIKLSEAMPDDAYSFQPVPAVQTFVARVGHIASSNIGQCGGFLDKKHALSGQKLEETLKTKAEAVDALKASFALCDEFFNTLDQRGNLMDGTFTVNGRTRDGQPVTIKMGYAGSIAGLLGHNEEMYGYMSMYLRLKGITPPTSSK
jgi:hypothetical protein